MTPINAGSHTATPFSPDQASITTVSSNQPVVSYLLLFFPSFLSICATPAVFFAEVTFRFIGSVMSAAA